MRQVRDIGQDMYREFLAEHCATRPVTVAVGGSFINFDEWHRTHEHPRA